MGCPYRNLSRFVFLLLSYLTGCKLRQRRSYSWGTLEPVVRHRPCQKDLHLCVQKEGELAQGVESIVCHVKVSFGDVVRSANLRLRRKEKIS